MKKTPFPKSLIFALLALFPLQSLLAQSDLMILKPNRADIIKVKTAFDVETNIDNYSPGQYHYWVGIASVKNADSFMAGTLSTDRDLVLKDMEGWQLDLIWPKYYIRDNPNVSSLFEGGVNPSPFLQPAFIVIIKADNQLSGFINNWFKVASTKNFPGIPASRFNGAIISKLEVFFP